MLGNMRDTIEKVAIPQAKIVWGQVKRAVCEMTRAAARRVSTERAARSLAKKVCVFSVFFGFAVIFMGGIAGIPLYRNIEALNTELEEAAAWPAAAVKPVAVTKPIADLPKLPVDDILYERLIPHTEEITEAGKTPPAEDEPKQSSDNTAPAIRTPYTASATASLREQERIARQSAEEYAAEQAIIAAGREEEAKAGEEEGELETAAAGDEQQPELAEAAAWVQPDYAGAPAQPGGFIYSDVIPMSYELQAYTYEKCVQRGLEYPLVLAVIWRESRFRADAVNVNRNGTRDSGIMQINDVNRGWLYEQHGIDNLMDPYQNINAGTAMLGAFTHKYGPHYALLAYQFGEAGMKQRVGRGQTTHSLIEMVYRQRDYYRQFVS